MPLNTAGGGKDRENNTSPTEVSTVDRLQKRKEKGSKGIRGAPGLRRIPTGLSPEEICSTITQKEKRSEQKVMQIRNRFILKQDDTCCIINRHISIPVVAVKSSDETASLLKSNMIQMRVRRAQKEKEPKSTKSRQYNKRLCL